MENIEQFYLDLKNVATSLYYSNRKYGKNEFYEKMGQDVRTYRLPMNMFAGKEGVIINETGQASLSYETAEVLKQLSSNEGWNIGSEYHGEENGPTIYTINMTAPTTVLESFKQEFTSKNSISK